MVKKLSSISLRIVRDSDSKFLFELLKERDPRANISHKKMPSYDELPRATTGAVTLQYMENGESRTGWAAGRKHAPMCM